MLIVVLRRDGGGGGGGGMEENRLGFGVHCGLKMRMAMVMIRRRCWW